jgi:hypothetical protein
VQRRNEGKNNRPKKNRCPHFVVALSGSLKRVSSIRATDGAGSEVVERSDSPVEFRRFIFRKPRKLLVLALWFRQYNVVVLLKHG